MTLQTGTGNPKMGIKVQLYGPTGKLISTAYTDADGFYPIVYKHTGKAAQYKVKLPDYGLEKSVTLKANGYAIVIFNNLP